MLSVFRFIEGFMVALVCETGFQDSKRESGLLIAPRNAQRCPSYP